MVATGSDGARRAVAAAGTGPRHHGERGTACPHAAGGGDSVRLVLGRSARDAAGGAGSIAVSRPTVPPGGGWRSRESLG